MPNSSKRKDRITTVSMGEEEFVEANRLATKEGYKSLSAFLRHLIKECSRSSQFESAKDTLTRIEYVNGKKE